MAAIIFLSNFLLILGLRIGATGYSPGYTATGPAYSIERPPSLQSDYYKTLNKGGNDASYKQILQHDCSHPKRQQYHSYGNMGC